MEPCYDQHCSSRYYYLYIYSNAGQCATATTTLDVTVTGAVTPTFDPVGNLCIGATAPDYLLLSNNGINGTWNPATISTAAAGTTTYTFTPDAGQCASPASIDITIAAQVTPVFTAIGPLCVGATAPILTSCFQQWNHWYLEPCNDQHCCCRYYYLYIYS
jgi:hypothetical protein